MIQKNILCVIQQPPYLGNRIFEALDAMLVAAAFEQQAVSYTHLTLPTNREV